MALYPLHKPIRISTGEAIGDPVPRDGVFVDNARDRADVPIVDERAPYNGATHVATDTEVAEPLPFNAGTTVWKLKRTTRAKTAPELAADSKALTQEQIRTGVLQLAQVTLTLIDKLLQKGTIVANDFDAATRTMYQDLKAKVDAQR